MDGTEALDGGASAPPPIDPSLQGGPNAPQSPPQGGGTPYLSGTGSAPPALGAPPAANVKPVSGVDHLLHAVADFLSPAATSTQVRDANGVMQTVPGKPRSTGQRVAAVGLEALTGAARAAAAPPGPGHISRGVASAVSGAAQDVKDEQQQQDEQADHDFTIQQKARQDNLNYQLGVRNLAAATFANVRAGVQASHEDIDFAAKMEAQQQTDGSFDLGQFSGAHDIHEVMQQQPKFFDRLNKGLVVGIPVYNGDGTVAGLHVYERKADANAQPAAAGAQFATWAPPAKPGEQPHIEWHTASDGQYSKGDIERINTATMAASQAFYKQQADLQHTQAETNQANAGAQKDRADASEAPSVIAKNYAEATRAIAEGNKANTDANGGDGAGSDDTIVRGMLNNTTDIRTIASLRNDHRQRLVQKAQALNPNWSEKQYESAMDTIKSFTSGEDAKSMQSFRRFAGHADSLDGAFRELRNGNSPLLNKPLNKIKNNLLGSTAMPDVLQFHDAVNNEHMNFMLGGRAPHDSDISERDASMNTSMTPAQMEGALKSKMRVELTQLGAMNYRHQVAVGRPAYGMVDPRTKAIIQNLGLEGYARQELGGAYEDGPPQQQQQGQQPQQQAPTLTQDHAHAAVAAGVPVGARPGYDGKGNLLGYMAGDGWHALGAK